MRSPSPKIEPTVRAARSMEDASGYDPHAYGLKVRSLSIWV